MLTFLVLKNDDIDLGEEGSVGIAVRSGDIVCYSDMFAEVVGRRVSFCVTKKALRRACEEGIIDFLV